MAATTQNEKWLTAHYDPVASLYTFTQCMELTDVSGDGESKLVVADLGNDNVDMKLKVYKGTSLAMENTIIDLPTGVKAFYLDQNQPRTPGIAVASGPYVYIYKNMRPYFKFTLPSLEVSPMEEEAWNAAKNSQIDWRRLKEVLDSLRNDGVPLTVRSHRFIQVQNDQANEFMNLHKFSPLKKQTVITCLETLNKTSPDVDAISCVIIGTESQQIYALDPEAFTILTTINLPSVPVFLSVSGIFDVEYRIIVACRNGVIYQLKRGDKSVEKGIQLSNYPLAMIRPNKNIIVACMDDTLQSFTTKGKRLWSTKMPASVSAMALMSYPVHGLNGVIVALDNSTVRIYKEKHKIDEFGVEDVVVGIVFGRYGREDGALLMTTRGGGLSVKILKRSAQFVESTELGGPPISQFSRLNVPKKTKLFVDQTMRERENGIAMHRQFMHDLSRLRLSSARSFVEALETRMNPVSTNPQEPLKLSAQVQGIGPVFRLTISLQNTSMTTATQDLILSFFYDSEIYRLDRSCILVPYLVPGVNYNFSTNAMCHNDKGVSDNIKIYVLKEGKELPIITAVVNMPVSESVTIV